MAGDPNAPLLGLLAILAALGALLVGSSGAPELTWVTAVAGAVTGGLALAGSVLVVADAGSIFGVPGDQALVVAVIAACAGAFMGRVPATSATALVLSALALVAIAISMATHTGVPPWVAWARLASEPARVFPATAAWVVEGRAVPRPITVDIAESQRITALTAGMFRVMEPGPSGGAVREWRLGPGDSVTVRAGDRLTMPQGIRVRFEAGKRIPGIAESGPAWADPRARRGARALWSALGLVVTLAGGAVALVGGPRDGGRPGALLAPLVLVILVVGAASWAVYAAWLVPDLALGASPLASVAAAPLAVATGAETPELTAAVGLAAVALLFATGASVVRRFEVLVDPWASSVWVRALPVLLGAGAAASAIALSRHGVDAENILRLGLGLGASAWAAPHLVGDRRGAAVGAIVGSVAFAGLSLMAAVDPHGLVALPALAVAPAPALPALAVIAFPALAAAPLAALVAALARSRPRRARAARPARAAPLGCSPEGTLPQ